MFTIFDKQSKQDTMITIENLKENRNEIISTLTCLFGKDKLHSNMRILLGIVEESEMFNLNRTIEECIDMLDDFNSSPRNKSTKTSELLGKLNELEIERS